MSSVDIGEGGLEDVPAVVDLWLDLAAEQQVHGSRVRSAANETLIREEVGRRAASGRLFVARDVGIVGFVTIGIEQGRLQKDGTVGLVKALYVVPDRRDEGIGSALLEQAEGALAERGATVTSLEALADNEAARRFYRERGYGPHRIVFEKPVESDNHSREAE